MKLRTFWAVDPPLNKMTLVLAAGQHLCISHWLTVADPEFTRRGEGDIEEGNCMEMKEIGPRGACIPDAPLDPPVFDPRYIANDNLPPKIFYLVLPGL